MNEIIYKSASEQHDAIISGKIKAVELLDAVYENIKSCDNSIGAFNSLTEDEAYECAKTVDEKVSKGETLPPLAGVPLALKDNINLKGFKTTASSKILENFVSPYDATVSKKLKVELIPIVGKTNLDEFAMGSSNENSAFKKVHNPWNLDKVPGGSSGGSAAAVAAGFSALALGSDTGGSIRLPASFCGIVGMKPTYGRVSRYGLIAFGSSLDQIGPFSKTVEDSAKLLNVISGCDKSDSTSLPEEVPDFCATLNNDIKGKKIGVIKELASEGLSEDVQKALDASIEIYKSLGAEIKEISLPLIKYSIAVYYVIATAEASSNLARFDGVRYGYRTPNPENLLDMYKKTRAEGFGDEVKRRIMLGTYALSSGYYDAYYKKAQQLRRLIKNDFDKAFDDVDVLICPTCPQTAFNIGEKSDDPLAMYLTDIATITANLAGIPAVSIPVNVDKDGMPVGLQIIAPALEEQKMFNFAHKAEEIFGFNNKFAPKRLCGKN